MSIIHNPEFGYQITGKNLGETWLNLLDCVLKNGMLEYDEDRARLACQGVRLLSLSHADDDPLIQKYGDPKLIARMRQLCFEEDVMEDFDITPSFRSGAKSYKKRLDEGKMIDFVIARLAKIPESKKAVIVFPTYEDYEQVKNSPYNDYLPCAVAVQFRLRKQGENTYTLNTHYFMRSQDAFQKNLCNLIMFSDLAKMVAKGITERAGYVINQGLIDGYITDAHIYKNTSDEAFKTVTAYLHEKDEQRTAKQSEAAS